MRYLILSDIHANHEALRAVLAHVKRKRWDKAIVLGDVVGYGANPNEDGEMFNRVALQAAMWTRQKLTPSNLRWLQSLPEGPVVVDGAFAASHGTPIDEDAYIFGEIEALNVFRQTAFPLCFFGHSHFPVIFGLSPDAIQTVLTTPPSFRFRLQPGVRYLVNPGSIGQPRDGIPLASFALFDSGTQSVSVYRLPYRIERAQQKILDAGLPRPLADRLALGR
jgi:diadenosine tetraphosphatase ApaH/serine/threonine PP2A family protein phosphatase